MRWRAPTAHSGDGRHVWFISSRGIVGLDSADLRRNTAPPHPVVLDVSTDDARFDAAQALRLPPGSQSFRVRFTAPSLRQPERTRFEFRLDGVDAGWRDSFLQSVYLLLLRLRKLTARLPEHDGARRELQAILDDTGKALDEGRDQVHALRVARTIDDIAGDCAASLRLLHPDVDVELRIEGTPGDAAQGLVDEAGAIACEALRNAFAHAGARRIVVTIGHGKHELSVKVEHDGRGIDQHVIGDGRREGRWGLVGMGERAARIGARLDIRSDAGNGTLVELHVPCP